MTVTEIFDIVKMRIEHSSIFLYVNKENPFLE